MTREFPVFGWLLPRGDQASFTSGVVDELWLGRRTSAVDTDPPSPTLPTEAQARTTMMQLMAYKVRFDAIVTWGVDPDGRQSPGRSSTGRGSFRHRRATRRVTGDAAEAGAADDAGGFDAVSREATRTPTSSNTLYVEYEWQRRLGARGDEGGSIVAGSNQVERHVSFWDGPGTMARDRAQVEDHPEDSNDAATRGHVRGVSDDEAWKCERCRLERLSRPAAESPERWHPRQAPRVERRENEPSMGM